ncbi:proton-translocating NADH-quinone oxidoreductase, chain M [Desulfotomaculum nigrificans CO-1-SRB]|uniref:Proton-translocating NADH-quinone oxidoreductase, chain M n=1 Tax=Desulfotomaculum nigrificans (strain DSM 14880 / VKM B-2319 / CO-1-SRB) TaxID=868595 RepID=F6B3G0_DESCC|nr:NADH-quinone oxidoreductase subunit M [Desulfotomaculum nigrificans]AEF93989.1 proton-translocating NADH-quinone oxidoreductase, chain M [Desulfotomaculum nigrificans CO-1-SRB]
MNFPVLTVTLLAPILAALFIVFIPREEEKLCKSVAALGTGVALALSLYVYFAYNQNAGGLQFVDFGRPIPWIRDLGVSYFLAVDGLSLPMLLLTNLIGFAAVFASWNVNHRTKELMILLLILISGVMGTFLAQDLFIFLLFYEVVVIPIYIMVIIWGSSKRVTKEYAGMKLTIYLLIGSAFLLVGIIATFIKSIEITGTANMSFQALAQVDFPEQFQIYMFALMLLGFGSLLSMWPFHSWSPDGYAGAPTAVSMIHAGVLKKIGGYGLIRLAVFVMPLGAKFWAPWIAVLGVAGVAYAAMGALAQKDLKYVVGYSSVSHMGYVLLGIASLGIIGVNGAVANMFAHGVMAALFFSMIGFIYERTHTRWIPDMGGLSHQAPRLSVGFMMASMASLGLPGLISFVPEFTIFVESFKIFGWLAVIAIAGIIITALYVLRAGANTLFGPAKSEFSHIKDLRGPEMVPLVVLGSVLVIGGLLPSLLFDMVNSGVAPILAHINDALQIGGR